MVGANGAGKSTLNKLLAGVLAPDAGAVRVDGEPVRVRRARWTRGRRGSRPCTSTLRVDGARGCPRPRTCCSTASRAARTGWVSPRRAGDGAGGGASPRRSASSCRARARRRRHAPQRLRAPAHRARAGARALAAAARARRADVGAGRRGGRAAVRRSSAGCASAASRSSTSRTACGEVEALAERVGGAARRPPGGEFARPFETRDVVHAMLGEVADDIEARRRAATRAARPWCGSRARACSPAASRSTSSCAPARCSG